MPKQEAPLSSLQKYIPPGSLPFVIQYLQQYKVHLTITRGRRTILGDYRHALGTKNHRISVNGNLNPQAFLITLIHELAHLVTFTRYDNKVPSHGKEWKQIYRSLLLQVLRHSIFQPDVHQALERSLHNLPATSCADVALMRVLKNYDVIQNGLIMVEKLQEGTLFSIGGGQIFKKGTLLRKRFQCLEIKSGKCYLFSPVYEVQPFK
ncbi:MAG: SprT-like domain-containing protein [Chitinophagaceae bacterium]